MHFGRIDCEEIVFFDSMLISFDSRVNRRPSPNKMIGLVG